jgi:glycine/D-amino acid oxidase-like deaminating enzyme
MRTPRSMTTRLRASVDRRDVLKALAAVSVGWSPAYLPARSAALRVVVVGAGIVGASVAMHLAQAGAHVTVLEKTGPAKGATEKSFAWLNTYTPDLHYRSVRLQSLHAYRALDIPLQLGITWGGYLNWTDSEADSAEIRAYAASLADSSQPLRRLNAAEVSEISPCIAPGPVAAAYFSTIDGHIDPVWVTYRLLGHAQLLGATLVAPCEVTGLEFRGERLTAVRTTQGRLATDRVVVAAGVDTPRLLAMAGFALRLAQAPGILAHTLPIPDLTRMVYDGPGGLEFKQMANGRIVGTDAPAPPDIPAHRDIRDHAMDFPDDALRQAHGQRILGHIARYMPALKAATLDRLTLGFRPMPLDGLPVVGGLPGRADVYVVVTHSGVTLAPILGQFVTREVIADQRVEWLAPYRPRRFST